jgi:lysosomal acid lipase/cholesteryl ester hydrolase
LSLLVLGVVLVAGSPPRRASSDKLTSAIQRHRFTARKNLGDDPEEYMDTPQLIEYYGYPAETHTVTTDDGYILTLHRIPHGIDSTTTSTTPVFIQHGLLSSSFDFVANGPAESLGFMLADQGYDVWFGNFRGNTYSRAHTTLDPDTDESFWEFSWDEMAEHDLKYFVDYVIETTGVDAFPYIGHSMGTSTMFALLSESKEYNNKITGFYAMAPVVFMSHVTSPLALLAPFSGIAEVLAELLGIGEFLPSDALMEFLGDTLCEAAPVVACENILFVICGYDVDQMNATRLPVYMAHTPAGTSVNTIVKYGQLIESGNFAKFDYGLVENLVKYGSISPPEWDLSKITVPVYLFWSQNDVFADPTDVSLLTPKLDTLKLKYEVPLAEFTHLDFQWAMQANTLIYNELISKIVE